MHTPQIFILDGLFWMNLNTEQLYCLLLFLVKCHGDDGYVVVVQIS